MTLRRRLIPLIGAAVGTALMGASVDGMAVLDRNLELASSKGPVHASPATNAEPRHDCPKFTRHEYERSEL
jgi:hypothetical protein